MPIKGAAGNPASEPGGMFSLGVKQVSSIFDFSEIKRAVEPIARQKLLILSPSNEYSQVLREMLKDFGPVAAYSGGLAKAKALEAWAALATGASQILISSRSGVFAPLPRDAAILIIADKEPGHISFDSKPHWDAAFIARLRALFENRELVVVSEAPALDLWAWARQKEMIARESVVLSVDLSDHRRAGVGGTISEKAEAAINDATRENKISVIVVNRKGSALLVKCRDCGNEELCERCSRPLRLFDHILRCNFCGGSRPLKERCPACGGVRLGESGITVRRVAKELAQKFSGNKILEQDSADDLVKSDAPAIVVGTEKLAHSLRPMLEKREIGAVIIVRAEQLFGLGEYFDEEDGYGLLAAFRSLAERQAARFIVQADNPKSRAIAALSGPTGGFYEKILTERRTYQYPPTHILVRFETRSPKDLAEQEKAMRAVLPPESRLDKIASGIYIARFETKDGLLPASFQKIMNDWSWRIDRDAIS
jgi:primosomal protein N' (replication factor Y)